MGKKQHKQRKQKVLLATVSSSTPADCVGGAVEATARTAQHSKKEPGTAQPVLLDYLRCPLLPPRLPMPRRH